MTKSGVRNTLAELRARRGLGPAQLAAQVGISRQTIYAIETGAYVPNTTVSLKLARVLDTSVEEIFQLEEQENGAAETADGIVLGAADELMEGQPMRLCRVDHHLMAVPPEPGGWGLPSTDAILLSLRGGSCNEKHATHAKFRIMGESWKNPGRLLIAGCDPSASILAGWMQREGGELIVAYENSSQSLRLLHDGLVHVAGTHLASRGDGKAGVASITAMFPRNAVACFSYAVWREGLVVAHGNPKKIGSISDLTRKDVQFANREPGAGCRLLLDELLCEFGIHSGDVNGYTRIVRGQLPAARQVQAGEVDCCVCAEAAARTLGLDFVPLAEKPYWLVVHRKHLNLPPVQMLLQTLGRQSFRREVGACVGYDMRTSGARVN